MADAPETKSIVVTKALHDYARRPRHPARRRAAGADRATRGARRHLDDADRARAGRVHDDAHAAARRAVRGRGRHVHRLLVALHRRAAWPTAASSLCCDVSEEWTAIGREHWEQAGVADRIDLRIAPALDTLARCPTTSPSTSRSSTPTSPATRTYYEEILAAAAARTALILVDNVLWSGRVIDDVDDDDDTVAIRRSTTTSPPTTASTSSCSRSPTASPSPASAEGRPGGRPYEARRFVLMPPSTIAQSMHRSRRRTGTTQRSQHPRWQCSQAASPGSSGCLPHPWCGRAWRGRLRIVTAASLPVRRRRSPRQHSLRTAIARRPAGDTGSPRAPSAPPAVAARGWAGRPDPEEPR